MDSTDEGHILTEDQTRAVPDLNNDNAAEIDIAASVATSTSPTIPTGAGQPLNPPVVISNNDPKFKYKYPQARPTPEGVDDSEWNKLFTAADSRFYNKANKNAVTSKAKRESGETYELALQMLQEKREKAARKANNNVIGSSNSLASSLSTAAPKTKISNTKKPQPSKEVLTSGSRETTPATMDMAERIKTEARPRKAASDAPSEHNSPAPSPAPKIVSSAAPLKPQKTGSKKGTATSTKKQQAKKSLSKSRVNDTPSNSRHASNTPGPKSGVSSGDESNDGGEYCICRGPDDHRMMVFCEGGCEDWYHCSCVGIDEEDAKELLDRFICPMCNIPNKAFTTFKPICRYHNVGVLLNKPACRKAARAASDPPSKYCCDEHREAFWDYIVDRLREDDESSKGGTINQVEASDILNQSKDIDQFRALGEKPRLPKKEGADPDRPVGLDYLLPEEVKMLEDIKNKKTELQLRVRGYQNQHKLFRMVLARAKLAAQHLKETKPLCGYDNRMAFNEVQFEKWSKTTEGKTALETGILGPRTDETKHIDAHVPYDGQIILEAPVVPDVLNNICLSLEKSRCKHNKLSLWKEVHSTDLAYNMTLLNEQIDKLTLQEAEIIDDAETREATKGYYADNTTTQLF